MKYGLVAIGLWCVASALYALWRPASGGSRKHHDPVVTGAGLFLMLAFYSMIWVRDDYTWNMPRRPEPSARRVIPVDVDHGFTAYVTTEERLKLYRIYGLVCFAAVAMVGVTIARRR